MKDYIFFSLLFSGVLSVYSVFVGVIDIQLAKKVYSGKKPLFKSFFRNLEDENESKRIAKLLIPSQFIRAILMSFVLYPVLPFLKNMSFGL